jgi:hypothetical protein
VTFLMYRSHLELTTLIAIRYLAGIIECGSFWDIKYYESHRDIGRELFKRTTVLLEDLGLDTTVIDHCTPIDFESGPLDIRGMDLLCHAILIGAERWISHPGAPVLILETWVYHLGRLIKLLQRYDIS